MPIPASASACLSSSRRGCLITNRCQTGEAHSGTHGTSSPGIPQSPSRYLFAAFVLASPLGLLLALIPRAVYHFYIDAPHRLWGLSPLADQQIGGAAMALEQAVVLFVASAYFFLRFLSGEERADAYRDLDRSPSM